MPGYKKLPNARPIVNITIDEELLKEIEDYQFNHRISNRSRAFESLVVEGFKRLSEQNRLIKYSSFDEALKALTEGKEVNFIGKNNYTYRILPKQNFNALKNDGIVWEDLINGRWTIKQ